MAGAPWLQGCWSADSAGSWWGGEGRAGRTQHPLAAVAPPRVPSKVVSAEGGSPAGEAAKLSLRECLQPAGPLPLQCHSQPKWS